MNLSNAEQAETAVQQDIAVIGMSCLLPGAPDLDTYWQNIVSKVDAITDPPPESWMPDVFYDPNSSANDRVYCKKGGFISPLTYFDPLEHGIMPRAAEGGEPDQWLALQVARAALADAGYVDEIPERQRTAVILGKGTYLNRGNLSAVQHGRVVNQTLEILKTLHPEYSEAELQIIREELKQGLPPFNADTVSGLIPNIIAGRIANRLDLMGPTYTVDAACASSLIAIDIAVRNLLTHQCDLALVGGAHVVTPVPVLMLFCQLNALSRQEMVRPFDKDADGTVLGEGIGMIVLKRCEDAERDGHRIYATIKGVGTSSDGRGMSVMAPRLDGEVLAMQRAYEMAKISPRTVGLIEAHGTGTSVGDVTEAKALTEVFGLRNEALPWCALGSVKSMIGHVMPAAGIAGLIKAVLALHHKVLPPTLNVSEPNPDLDLKEMPFYINTEARPWIHGTHNTPRRAGVNAFGFGGINAHVILEEAPTVNVSTFQSRQQQWDTEVCIVAATSRPALLEQAQQLRHFLQAEPEISLKDLAYTLNVPLDASANRLAIVANNIGNLLEKLDQAVKRLSDPQCRQIKDAQGIYYFEEPLAGRRQLAFLFPGEGSQYINMLADICLHFPDVREQFDMIDRIFSRHARNYVPSDLIFPRSTFSETERKRAEDRVWQMEGAVEAVLVANRALCALLNYLEIHPDCVVGHSTGEYSAMLTSGMIELGTEELVGQFSLELNQIYQQAAVEDGISDATLIAVAAAFEDVSAIVDKIDGDIYVAMNNCPHQTVIVGEERAAEEAVEQLRRRGLIHERLPFDRPYHTPLFETYVERLQPFFARWIIGPPRIKTYSCTTMSPFPNDRVHARKVATEHWLRPVEFRKTVETMYANGVRIFVEVGPSGNLTSFVNDILRGKPHLAVPANIKNRSGITQLNHLVGMLAAQATPMKLDYLYRHRSPRKLNLERPDDPYGNGRKSNSRTKLATGWPPMRISEEMAARLRSRNQTAPPEAFLPNNHRAAPMNKEPPSVTVTDSEQVTAGVAFQLLTPAAETDEAVNTLTTLDDDKPTTALYQAEIPSASSTRVMSAHLNTMNQFLSVQQDVMQAFLARQAGVEAPSEPSVLPADRTKESLNAGGTQQELSHASGATPQTQTAPQSDETGPSGVAKTDVLNADVIRDMLLNLVSERTGYPIEMLDLNLDMEAHLGIDSIKRIEILGSLQQQTGLLQTEDMEALAGRKTLKELVEFLTAHVDKTVDSEPTSVSAAVQESSVQASEANSSLPLIGSVFSLTPGKALVAIREINLEEDIFLRDHTLGRHISVTDAELRGLPVVPLTISLEMLAEGASLLMPGQQLVEVRNLRAYQWIALEGDTLKLELVANRKSSGSASEVYVYIREAAETGEAHTQNAAPIIEGTMVFAQTVPEPPTADEFTLRAGQPSKWRSERLYQDGMFHGPTFQGVLSMDQIGDDGAEATLTVGQTDNLFRSDLEPSFITDPVLLDQPGQVVGLWAAERLDTGYVIFPFNLESLHLYNTHSKPSEYLKCRARINLIGEHQVRSDLDIVGSDDRVWARFVGWEDRRFDLPDVFSRFLHSPQDVMLSQPWAAPIASFPERAAFQAQQLSIDAFPQDFFTAHGGLWRRVLAHLILSRRERDLWANLTMPELRRLEWLLGRVVAKDAVRHYLKQQHNVTLCPADIEILPDDEGCPLVHGSWVDQVPYLPILSISHSAGTAAAVACAGVANDGVGVDIEYIGHMNKETEMLAFADHERELLSRVPEAKQEEWLLRFWCAKESVAKAIGHGMNNGPQALTIQALDTSSGVVEVGLVRELERRVQKETSGPIVTAFTVREGDLIVATSLISFEFAKKEG